VAHFYLASTPGPFAVGDEVSLEADEAHHAARVARLTTGERVALGDGRGSTALAEAIDIAKGRVRLRVLEARYEPAEHPEVWLAQALAKGGRDEAAIQMACELGVDRVIPFAAERSVSVWKGDKEHTGVERWRKIVQEAAKQSMRAWIPEVSGLSDLAGLLALVGHAELVVLDPDAAIPLGGWTPRGDTPVLLVVGPEGGLSASELEAFAKRGATAYKLGRTVLRTSTAAPAALGLVNRALGRW